MIQAAADLMALVPLALLMRRVAGNLRIRARRFFFTALSCIGAWIVLDLLSLFSGDPGTALLLRLAVMLVLSTGTLFLVLTGVSLAKSSTVHGLLLGSIPLVLLLVTAPYIEMAPGPAGFVPKPSIPLIAWHLGVLLTFFSFPLLVCRICRSLNEENKKRLKWFTFSVVLVGVSGVACAQLSFRLGLPYLAPLASSLSLLPAMRSFGK